MTAPQLSYGHSDGRVETKEQFINAVMTRKQIVKSLAFPELKVAVVGNAAVARHIYLSESELDGKATTTRIGALQVWQKQDGAWKLLARQGFRLRPNRRPQFGRRRCCLRALERRHDLGREALELLEDHRLGRADGLADVDDFEARVLVLDLHELLGDQLRGPDQPRAGLDRVAQRRQPGLTRALGIGGRRRSARA